jgi:hypothetical protein
MTREAGVCSFSLGRDVHALCGDGCAGPDRDRDSGLLGDVGEALVLLGGEVDGNGDRSGDGRSIGVISSSRWANGLVFNAE